LILGAAIQLKDQFSTTFNRLRKDTNTAKTKLDLLGKTVVRPVIAIKDNATRAIRNIKDNLLSLKGLAAGVLVGLGMETAGRATIGSAMAKEQQMITMSTLLGSEEKAKEFLSWGNKEASLAGKTSTEMMQAMTNLTPFAKDLPTMQKYVRMTEVLASINPLEGMEGATFALKEALSGDFVSLQERFNLPRSTINALKEGAKTSDEFFNVVQKAAESQGFTYELVERQGRSSAGLWQKIKGQMSSGLTTVGEGILEGLKPQLQGITTWIDQNEGKISGWVTNFGQRLGRSITTVSGFVSQYMPTIKAGFSSVLDWLGPKIDWVRSKIPFLQNVWQTAWPIISSVLQTAWSIASPILNTIWSVIEIIGSVFERVWPSIVRVVETAWAVLKPIFDALAGGLKLIAKGVKWVAEKFNASPGEIAVEGGGGEEPHSNASGLPYVPYDNYLTRLHRGERVVTAAENRQLERNGTGAKVPIINITINAANMTEDQIVSMVENRLLRVAMNMGG